MKSLILKSLKIFQMSIEIDHPVIYTTMSNEMFHNKVLYNTILFNCIRMRPNQYNFFIIHMLNNSRNIPAATIQGYNTLVAESAFADDSGSAVGVSIRASVG